MAGSSGLPLAGVEAIVEGLSAFQGDVRSMNSALDSIRPRGTLLQNIFESAWETVKGFGREILNVAEYALGHLLADAVEFVVQKIGELITATIDAGSEFQALQIRLDRLNLNDAIESGESYSSAMKIATEATKEQLDWVRALAVATPYDAQDIANVYTLARGYSFTDKEAKILTEDITNFAAGMGLGNTEIQRIIVNFGQMVQQGKVTQREMNDLARGAFVPVNDILKRMAKNTGIAESELDDFRKTGESVPAFMQAFSDIVEERFLGAAEDMARTFKGASANAVDFFKNLLGFNVVVPILDKIGGRLADIISSLTKTDDAGGVGSAADQQDLLPDQKFRGQVQTSLSTWERLEAAAQRVGLAISGIIEDLFGLMPSTEGLADTIIGLLNKTATWLEENGPGIVTFFQGVGNTIRDDVIPFLEKIVTWAIENGPEIKEVFKEFGRIIQENVVPWIRDHLIPFLEKVATWVEDNGPTIKEFFTTIGEIGGTVFKDVMEWLGKEVEEDNILDSITKFMEYVIENKEKIAEWVGILVKAFIIWQAIATVWSIVIGIVIPLIGFILGLVAVFSALNAVVAFLAPIIMVLLPIMLFLAAAIAAIIIQIKLVTFFWGIGVAAFTAAVDAIKAGLDRLLANFRETVAKVKLAFSNGDWNGVGKAIIDGVSNGISLAVGTLVNAAKKAAMAAYAAAKKALGISSPSTLFMEIGEFTMEGFAQGIEKAAGLAVGAMQNAVGQVAMPAISSMAAAQANGGTVNNNNTANLTINSSAPTEPIIQDFNMLSSLMGA